MKYVIRLAIAGLAVILFAETASADIKIVPDHNNGDNASPAFKFRNVPSPSKTDSGTKAKFTIVDGERDENGGDVDVLHDGKLPSEEDQPGANFFFSAGTAGGRLGVDLGDVTEIQQVNTYSWHPSSRGPQVYTLYASDGKADGFDAKPKKSVDPEKCGWKLIGKVDTRSSSDGNGGQYGVSISDPDGSIGKYRYLLFNIASTESDDDFGNTFYSEIDVVAKGDEVAAQSSDSSASELPPYVTHSVDGKCEITIDTSAAPDLTDWATNKLAPTLAAWYPKIVAMLPSEGFSAPTNFSVIIKPGRGVAATGGRRITANSNWLKNELNREAIGSIVHEEVHVVQQYGGGRRNNSGTRPPGYLVEGIPDYIRFYLFEPQTHGADIKSQRALERAKYDGLYRVTANFLNFLVQNYDKDIVTKMNAACRQRKYSDDLWKEYTGKTVAELNDEWKQKLCQEIAANAEPNKLTEAEKAAGWQLLFDGKTFNGWHNFKLKGVLPGWQIKDGAMVCADPHDARDIVTSNQFEWFELQLDYNISEAGNSGIMYHVTDKGGAVWATGPEFQLEDNVKAADPIRCGWLYALYQPPDDPKTGHPLDATKPVGKWNHVRLLVSPEKCEHDINGVKYFDYVLHSEDFNGRVARSKFRSMANFAKSDLGYIALQGDHGSVSFRNIKIRCIDAKKSS